MLRYESIIIGSHGHQGVGGIFMSKFKASGRNVSQQIHPALAAFISSNQEKRNDKLKCWHSTSQDQVLADSLNPR